MDAITNLEDLLMHYIGDLYTVEQLVLSAMPSIVQKAQHQSLKNALKHHLELSEQHIKRLEKIGEELDGLQKQSIGPSINTLNQNHESLAMKAVLQEAELLLNANVDPKVMDAAIIGAVQKIEHYEICLYGTALAFARQLHLTNISALLTETLDEEYDADDLLTALATAGYNKKAEPEDRRKQLENDRSNSTEQSLYTGPNEHATTGTNRSIQSPGGRAGTSHRGYSNGESRGH